MESLKANFEERGATCLSPRMVLKTGKAHCIEGVMLAAEILEFHGFRPLVMDLRAVKHDGDHVVAVFKHMGPFPKLTTRFCATVSRFIKPRANWFCLFSMNTFWTMVKKPCGNIRARLI